MDDMESKNKDNTWFDRNYVTALIANGQTPEAALKANEALASRFSTPAAAPAAPIVLGSGSLPSNQKPVAEMTEEDAQKLVVDLIKSQHEAAK
jgi:hypothetical protein